MPKEKSKKHHHRRHHHHRKKDKQLKRSVDSEDDIDILDQLKKLAKEHNAKEEKMVKNTSRTSAHPRHHKGDRREEVMTPMTKEDYEKQRSIIRTELDPQTGRMRRVRATGEILESIVSKEEHHRINKLSTMNDGLSYSRTIIKKSME
ncbi:nuclear RNA-splicing-associated protein-domain-containing protein [Mycotypha africana]|uniref:nuclear RNA-splicing-associated protein-domain-containing protein n=1 Tax=Mycotypha africana TaxID=64632 RepID=UPI0023006A18|nr:nuclear RNA-splicing-associated protein-domain-containing protein [Mycotypha africana]KAI8981675.1 nuclear RNA-splicing-associated protein-domain-containing protein [Mycotypha africana]